MAPTLERCPILRPGRAACFSYKCRRTPGTASAASNVSAAAALPGQFLDTLIGSWNTLINDLSVYVQTLYNVAYLSALVAYEAAILSYLLLNFAILNVRGLLSQMFGITIPLSLPSL